MTEPIPTIAPGTDERAELRARASGFLTAAAIPVGQRNDAILSVMYMLAEEGTTNHEILAKAQELGERWGKYIGANLYDDWSHMLGMLRTVRRKYPNPHRQISTTAGTSDGNGETGNNG